MVTLSDRRCICLRMHGAFGICDAEAFCLQMPQRMAAWAALIFIDDDAADHAVVAVHVVIHLHRSAYFDAGWQVRGGDDLAVSGFIDHLLAIAVGHRAGGFLHDESASRHVFGDGAVTIGGRLGGGCGCGLLVLGFDHGDSRKGTWKDQ